MNTNHLSVGEIVQYISSGVITEVSGEDFLRVVDELNEKYTDSYENGYNIGYGDAEEFYTRKDFA